MADLQHISLDQLHPHPDNPRIGLREDVVERLAAKMKTDGFGQEHAILARPHGDGWQIISGHHRVEAAKQAGLTEAPVWVREMDDYEAFMLLVLCNNQGELKLLEIGMHALKAVPLSEGGRGKKGGLSGYAEEIGFDKSRVSQLRSAARVADTVETSKQYLVTDRPYHLYEISKAPRETWPALVGSLVKRAWTVADTKATVDKVRQFEISNLDEPWLPLPLVVERFLASGKPGPAAVQQLAGSAYTVFNAIDERGDEDQNEDNDAFMAWLIANAGRDSWDRKKISEYHVTLIRKWSNRDAAAAAAAAEEEDDGPKLPDGVELRLGDFREVLKDIEPGTINAIVTDPPYPAEFLPLFADLADLAARTLKPGGLCAVMVGQSYLPDVYRLMARDDLAYQWTLAYLTPGGQATQLWQRKVNTFWKPILVYTKGQYDGPWIGDVATSDVNDNDKNHHHWGQSESGMADLLDRLTQPGDLVCDPFLGGGTTAVVAHQLGRRFIGCDIDEAHIVTTTDRFGSEA